MAELTTAAPAGDHDRSDGAAAAAAPVADDPRAVRVRLAPGSQLGDEPVLRVAPAAEVLQPTNPTVGIGPLGGAAVPAAEPKRGTVRAQRHPLLDGQPTDATIRTLGRGRLILDEAGRRTRVVLEPYRAGPGRVVVREVLVDGFRFEVELEPERIAALRERATKGRESSAHSGPLEVRAIIPGKVVAVSVGPGDEVTAGQQLLVVEAMKMQNELRAPRDGTIDRVAVAQGVNIEVGDLLMVIS